MVIRVNKLLRFLRGHEPDVNALSAHLDGHLDATAAARLDEHVASCDACRGVRDGLRATRDALRAMPEAAPTRSFRLRAADVERRAERTVLAAGVARWAPGAIATALVTIAIVGAYATLRDERGTSSMVQLASAPPATSAAGSANMSKSFADSSAPELDSDTAPPVADSPVAALAPGPIGGADGGATADAAASPVAELTIPYSSSTTPTPTVQRQGSEAVETAAGGLLASRTTDSDWNKSTAAIVELITW